MSGRPKASRTRAGGERVTLRKVAGRADMANFGAHPWTGGAKYPRRRLRKYGVNVVQLDLAFGEVVDEIEWRGVVQAPDPDGGVPERAWDRVGRIRRRPLP